MYFPSTPSHTSFPTPMVPPSTKVVRFRMTNCAYQREPRGGGGGYYTGGSTGTEGPVEKGPKLQR